MSRIGHFPLSLTALLVLLSSCTQQPMSPEPPVGMHTLRYQVSVDQSAPTKASLDGSNHYVFQEGDLLYVSAIGANADKLYGSLQLISRASDNRTAVFEGDLYCSNDFSPTSTTELLVTLVGADDEIHSTSGGRITSTTYSTSACADTFSEAVQKFSHFTASGHYGDRSFVLSQRSSFLCCSVKYSKTDTPENTELTIKILDSSNAELRTATVMAYETTYISKADFVAAFPENANLTGAYLTSKQGVYDPKVMPAIKDGESILLEANTYYNVNRSTLAGWDGFRIKATEDGTNISFNYLDANIQYSFDDGTSWNNYSGGNIPLNAGDEICVQGERQNYKNVGNDTNGTPSSNPLFKEDNNKLCYISGNIMSLLADKENIVPSAFHGTFSKGNTEIQYIDIDPDADLILPDTSLEDYCYMQMFRYCTSLKKAPKFRVESVGIRSCYNMLRNTRITNVDNIELPALELAEDCYRELFRQTSITVSPSLPATTLAKSCYQQMFAGSTIIEAPLLPATTLAESCYQQMFSDCANLVSCPLLPAPTLVKSCYYQMLYNCKKLMSVTCLATVISATDCTKEWMKGVTNDSSRTFYKASSMTSWTSGDNGIPSNWRIQDYSEP